MDPTIQKKVEMLQHIFKVALPSWGIWFFIFIGLLFAWFFPVAFIASEEEAESFSESPISNLLWILLYFLNMAFSRIWLDSLHIIHNYPSTIGLEKYNKLILLPWYVIGIIGSMGLFWIFPKRPRSAIIFVLTILAWPLLNQLIFPSGMPVHALFLKGMWILGLEFSIMAVGMTVTGFIGYLGMGVIPYFEKSPDEDQQKIARIKKRIRILNVISFILGFITVVLLLRKIAYSVFIISAHKMEGYLILITALMLSVRVMWPIVKKITSELYSSDSDETDDSGTDEDETDASKETEESLNDNSDTGGNDETEISDDEKSPGSSGDNMTMNAIKIRKGRKHKGKHKKDRKR